MKLSLLLLLSLFAFSWLTAKGDNEDGQQVSTNNESNEHALELMRMHEQQPASVSNDQLMLVAKGYTLVTNLAKAATVYKRLLETDPKNPEVIRRIGYCYFLSRQFDKAAIEFRKAWGFGDNKSLLALANTMVALKQYEEIEPLIPDLLKNRDRMTEQNEKHELVNLLVAYSLYGTNPPSKALFDEAIHGLTDEFILKRADTKSLVQIGLKTFGYTTRAESLEEEDTRVDMLKRIRDYETNPQDWPVNRLLLVASAYFVQTNYPKAQAVFERILNIEPTNTVAVRFSGVCWLFSGQYENAALQFKKGWALNDPKSYDAFADMFSQMMRFGTNVTPFVSDAFEIRDKVTNPDYKQKLVRALVAYSMTLPSTDDKAVFLKAIDGLPDEFILENKATTQAVVKGLEKSQETDRATKLRQKANL